MTIYERLNYQNDLTDQNRNSDYVVLFVSSATYMASCVVKPKTVYSITVGKSFYEISNFFADHTTYYYYTNNADEAYYLSAILNSKVIDNLIKPLQARGSFGGARHVHKNPLSFPIPEYDSGIKLHRELAQDGECCHIKVRDDILTNVSYRSIGKTRGFIRERLSNEYSRIDTNTMSILNNVKIPKPKLL